MKDAILRKSAEIFLKYGFKSVTMDDIANELGISKKTIYKYYNNKVELVDEAISNLHESMHESIDSICHAGFDAIEENFEIKKMFKDMFKNSDDSPMYQLEKYYPKTFKKIISNEFAMFKDCIVKNLEKGTSEGLYRQNLDIELITKLYFSLAMSVYDTKLFTHDKNTVNKLELKVLEYHTRAIATPKGLAVLEKQLKKYAL
jgi:AcrR family transcriptional regulator